MLRPILWSTAGPRARWDNLGRSTKDACRPGEIKAQDRALVTALIPDWVDRVCRSNYTTAPHRTVRAAAGGAQPARIGYGYSMLFIFGLRTKAYRLGASTLTCRNCGNVAAQVLTRRVTRFTLFFIPLFPVASRYVMQCTACGVVYAVSRRDATALAGR